MNITVAALFINISECLEPLIGPLFLLTNQGCNKLYELECTTLLGYGISYIIMTATKRQKSKANFDSIFIEDSYETAKSKYMMR